jgi:hypothetical protein
VPSHPYREVRDALTVQIAKHSRVGDQVVGQHHQVGLDGGHRSVGLAAVLHPGARAAQTFDQQLGQRAAAVDPDRRRPRRPLPGIAGGNARRHQLPGQIA